MKHLFRTAWIALALTLCLVIPSTAHAQIDEYHRVERQSGELLKKGEFAKLEELKKQVSSKPEDIRELFPLTAAFYAGIDLDSKTPEKQLLELKEQLDKWEAFAPDSLTPKIALMEWHITYAWHARGSGYANTVTDEGRRLMRERLNTAIAIGESIDSDTVDDPQYFSVLHTAARGRADTVLAEEVFRKGNKKFPENLALYKQYANFLLPKWFGSEGTVESLATRLGDKLGGDKGDALYAIIAMVKLNDRRTPTSYFLRDTKADYERIKRGMMAIKAANYPGAHWKIGQQLSYVASIAGDMDTARSMLLMAIGNRATAYFPDEGLYVRMFDLSGAQNFLNEIATLEQRGQLDEAEKRLRNIDPTRERSALLDDFYLRNGMEEKYIALTNNEFRTNSDPLKGPIADIYYVGLFNILFDKYDISKQAAERFDQTRPWNLGGRTALLFNALIDGDDEKIAALYQKTIGFDSKRPGYMLVQAVLKGEKNNEDVVQFLEKTDTHDDQTGLFLIGYYLHKKDPETVRRLIEILQTNKRVTNTHRSFAKSLLQGKLQPLLAKAEAGK